MFQCEQMLAEVQPLDTRWLRSLRLRRAHYSAQWRCTPAAARIQSDTACERVSRGGGGAAAPPAHSYDRDKRETLPALWRLSAA